MDWYLDGRDVNAVSALRREIAAYLIRHASPDSDLDAAELVVSEILGNVHRHAPGPAWVSLTWSSEAPELVVRDLGARFDADRELGVGADLVDADLPDDPFAEHGRGLFLVAAMAPRLESVAREVGGTIVTTVLPVLRPAEVSYGSPSERGSSLPDLEEALPEGGFGRESFLRALVVELAQGMERVGGPALAERVVADVGIAVGAQMEQEYRLARAVVDRLPADRLAECLVRLKHAIDGGFEVVELTDDHIVFTNDRCPFGDVVRQAPALCRMTSSVFGGIAARNSEDGQAAVVLEERIAVGDPGCRIVVHLGPPAAQLVSFAHRYGTPGAGADRDRIDG